MSYMDTQTIDKQKMDSLTALANTNIAISQAKATLEALKSEESAYIQDREQRAVAKIQSILTNSKEVLTESLQNYLSVHELSKTAGEFAQKIQDVYAQFGKLQETFAEATSEWEKEISDSQIILNEIKRLNKIDKIQIKNDQEAIVRQRKLLHDSEVKLASDWGTLERELIRLKNRTK